MDVQILLSVMAILAGGVLIGAGCVVLGAWVAFRVRRVPGEGAGFVKDPKGEVFSIQDDTGLPSFPGMDEPDAAEQKVLQRANRFLQGFGGEK